MGCKKSKLTQKPEIIKCEKPVLKSILKPEIPEKPVRKNMEGRSRTYRDVYTTKLYTDYACSTPIPIPETN